MFEALPIFLLPEAERLPEAAFLSRVFRTDRIFMAAYAFLTEKNSFAAIGFPDRCISLTGTEFLTGQIILAECSN